MKLPTHLDPTLNTLFDPDQKPSEEEFYRQLQQAGEHTDHRWIGERGYAAQQEFLLKLDALKKGEKNL